MLVAEEEKQISIAEAFEALFIKDALQFLYVVYFIIELRSKIRGEDSEIMKQKTEWLLMYYAL